MEQEIEEWRLQQFTRKAVSLGTEIIDESCEVPNECPTCGVSDGTVARRRRNSAYVDDAENWLVSCMSCYKEDWQRLQGDWDEYYDLVFPR
jgi:hypothetical protein